MKTIYKTLVIMLLGMFTQQNVNAESNTSGGDLYTVTFRVDMNEYSGTYSMVNVNGLFNSWCGECAVMTDGDGDGVYEIDIELEAGATQYKFTVDGWDDEENLLPGSECTFTSGEFTNRTLTVTDNEVLDIVCWESCEDCENNINNYDVTFQVDMNEYTGTYTNVNINGVFNDWCGGCAIMNDGDGDGIYEITITLPEGSAEYKFTLDGWNVEETLSPGSSCTLTTEGFTNRLINVSENVILDPVCWESCATCGNETPIYDVTFRVDMSLYTGTYSMVNVNGIFNDWCGECAVMTDGDGDDIYEITIPIEEGSTEYKFTLDGWTVEEMLMEGMDCTLTTDGFTNRFLDVSSTETLDAVCWESCSACLPDNVIENEALNSLNVFPNPSNGIVNINGSGIENFNLEIEVYDHLGKMVYSGNMNSNNEQIDLTELSNGIYQLRFYSDNGFIQKSVSILR